MNQKQNKYSQIEGQTILVTRSMKQGLSLCHALKKHGANVIHVPVIDIEAIPIHQKEQTILQNVHEFDWLLLTSINAAQFFLHSISKEKTQNIQPIRSCQIACVGKTTQRFLESNAAFQTTIYCEKNAATLLQFFLEKQSIAEQSFLFPCSQKTLHTLPEGLRAHRANVTQIPLYQPVKKPFDASSILAKIRQGNIDIISLTSPSIVHAFLNHLDVETLKMYRHSFQWACIGKTTAGALRERGFAASIVANTPTIDALIDAIVHFCSSRTKINDNRQKG